MRLISILLSCVFLACVGAARAASPLDDALLVKALRGGGYYLYFRHQATDWTQSDQVAGAGDWLSCDGHRIRQLSTAGRLNARATGIAMRQLGVPVSRVLASPYCRTMDTARLLGYGDPEASSKIINLRVASYHGGRDAVIATTRRLLATPPPAGFNIVLVAHGNLARAATSIYPGEGEALIFTPNGSGGFEFVGRLPPGRWLELANREPLAPSGEKSLQ